MLNLKPAGKHIVIFLSAGILFACTTDDTALVPASPNGPEKTTAEPETTPKEAEPVEWSGGLATICQGNETKTVLVAGPRQYCGALSAWVLNGEPPSERELIVSENWDWGENTKQIKFCKDGSCQQEGLAITNVEVGPEGWTANFTLNESDIEGSLNIQSCPDPVLHPNQVISRSHTIQEVSVNQGTNIVLGANGPLAEQVPVIAGKAAAIFVLIDPPANVSVHYSIERPNGALASGEFQPINHQFVGYSHYTTIGKSAIQDGTNLRVEIREDWYCGIEAQSPLSEAVFPPTGVGAPLMATPAPQIRVELIPYRYTWDGSDRVPQISPQVVENFRDALVDYFPIAEPIIHLQPVRDYELPVTGDFSLGVFLGAVAAARSLENPGNGVVYYGLIQPTETSDEYYADGAFAAGIASGYGGDLLSIQAAVGLYYRYFGSEEVFAHEIGHNKSLPHAPCGDPDGIDHAYPYPNAEIGKLGFSIRNGRIFVPFATYDLMSYCYPKGISDYNYKNLYQFLTEEAFEGEAFANYGRLLTFSDTEHHWSPEMRIPARASLGQTKGWFLSGLGTPIKDFQTEPTQLTDSFVRSVMVPNPPPGAVFVHIEGIGDFPLPTN